MLQPRNTMVQVRLKKKAEERLGNIIVPNLGECFCEAEVLAVGQDTLSIESGERATRDLRVGQRVLVKTHTAFISNGQVRDRKPVGIELKETITNERDLYLFEQNDILAILAQPEDVDPNFGTAFAKPTAENQYTTKGVTP